MAWDVLSGVTKTAWDVLSVVAEMAWDVFCPGDKNSMGCFVRGGKSLWDVLCGCQKMAWDILSWDFLSASLK